MPSTITTPITARIPNHLLAALRGRAEAQGTTPSAFIRKVVEREFDAELHVRALPDSANRLATEMRIPG